MENNNINKIQKTKVRKTYSKWTNEEDEFLLKLINNIGSKWKFISKYFPNKTIYQIYNRYFILNPDLKKGKFSPEEDEKLVSLIKIHAYNWTKISKDFLDRSPKQLRSRYINFLSKNYDLSEITKEEKEIIFTNYPILGNRWNEYVKILTKKRSPTFIRKALFQN